MLISEEHNMYLFLSAVSAALLCSTSEHFDGSESSSSESIRSSTQLVELVSSDGRVRDFF